MSEIQKRADAIGIKWADVAHYYSRSPITLVDDIGDIYDCSIAASLGYLYRWKPILRHLEDMTEDDALSLYKLVHGDDGGAYSSENCLSWASGCIEEDDMTAVFVHGCLQMGFDMYKLIESGQAIRKEVSNG